jgi:hypothetical protein
VAKPCTLPNIDVLDVPEGADENEKGLLILIVLLLYRNKILFHFG